MWGCFVWGCSVWGCSVGAPKNPNFWWGGKKFDFRTILKRNFGIGIFTRLNSSDTAKGSEPGTDARTPNPRPRKTPINSPKSFRRRGHIGVGSRTGVPKKTPTGPQPDPENRCPDPEFEPGFFLFFAIPYFTGNRNFRFHSPSYPSLFKFIYSIHPSICYSKTRARKNWFHYPPSSSAR